MGNTGLALVIGALLAVAAGWVWRRGRKAQRQARQHLACLEFLETRHGITDIFLRAADSTGKPRGLKWKSCELSDDLAFATDRANGDLYAVCAATVSFTAIPGGGMEDVEAVGNLRFATVFFVHRQGKWQSDGQAVFNLDPQQSLERYEESLAPLELELPSPAPSGK